MMKQIHLGRVGKERLVALFFGCFVVFACSGEEDGDDGNDDPAGVGGQTSQMNSGGTGGSFDGGGDGDGDGQTGDGDDLNQGELAENCLGEEPSEGASCGEDGLVCQDGKKQTCVCGGLSGGDWNNDLEWECFSVGTLPTGTGGDEGTGGDDGTGGSDGPGGMGGLGNQD
jgi:hypothetical protein